MCRSVHAEQNAIIHASRADMLGATLYLVGLECSPGNYVVGANPCTLCKRMIIHAGIAQVVVRDTRDQFRIIDVQRDYVEKDESLDEIKGY